MAALIAGAKWINDVAVLRAGETATVLGHWIAAASTMGTFLRAFTWGHVRQLDAVSGELLKRAWEMGAGPGADPLTIDVDSTICETYGLQKQGGSKFTYAKVRGYHPCWQWRRGWVTCCTRVCAGVPPSPRAGGGQLHHLGLAKYRVGLGTNSGGAGIRRPRPGPMAIASG